MLDSAALPGALKQMSLEDKERLAAEIRDRLIAVVPKTGGHLASNLGVVELTIALYSVLDPYSDRIIWDVGHQCYVHKLLTGRNAAFETLRQKDGLSGFPLRAESPADCMDTGHSSTSISAAVGLARARDLRGEKYRVVAVIGDGAFGSGMAYEALNDAGRMFNDLIILLNDNGMSISRNVGGMSRYLQRIRTRRSYVRLKKGVKNALQKIPRIGDALVRAIQRFKASIRLLVIPGELFEELGCKYIGPIDGHDIRAVQKAIEKAEYMGGPVIIHAITQKGKGYTPAETDPATYHGLSAPSASGHTSYSAHFGETLCKMAAEHSDIVAVSAAMINGTGLKNFTKQFPARYIDVGIAEPHAITMAAGLALGGMRPYVAMYSTFMQRAYDQFLHDCALQKLPVVVVLDRAGACGNDGKTHQGIFDLSFMNPMPDTVVCAPCCIGEQEQMLQLSYYTDRPFVLRYPARDTSTFDTTRLLAEPLRLGRGACVYGEAEPEVVFFTIGQITQEACTAAEMLRGAQIRCEVFHARFLHPLDEAGCLRVLHPTRTRLVVTMEDGVTEGGFGSRILALCNRERPGLAVHVMGFPCEPIPHGTIAEQYRAYGLDGESVARAVTELLDAARGPDTARRRGE